MNYPWIHAVRLQLRERFCEDLPVLRLHSDKGGEFASDLLRNFCHGEGIRQSFTLPASPQQNGVAERHIGLVIEVPRVSLPETSPTLRWTGEVDDASVFRFWGSRAFVREVSRKLSYHAIPCIFLGFPPDAPGWQFYHPTTCRVLPSQDVTFDKLVPFYRLFPYRTAPPVPFPVLGAAALGATACYCPSGLSGGAAPVAELAMLELEVLVLAVLYSSVGAALIAAALQEGCLSTPAGSATGRRGGSGGGQQRQQRPPETLSLQHLRGWAVRWGSLDGGAWGTSFGGGEAPGGVEAASLGAFDSASTGVEPEEALHTFTLDSGASRYFFRDSTTVTPLTVPVLVTLANPSRGPLVVRGATVLPCLAAPSGLLTGLHLPSFAKNLVATSVL
ncbi:unnamed protein product [Closterium sp. NIES-53]